MAVNSIATPTGLPDKECLGKIVKSISPHASPGRDGVNGSQFISNKDEEVDIIIRKTTSGKYRFVGYLEILKLKGKGKPPRVISKPSIRDKVLLRHINKYLIQTLRGRLSFHLPNELIRKVIAQYRSSLSLGMHFIKIDLTRFYDSIPKGPLLGRLRGDISPQMEWLITEAISTPTIPKGRRMSGSEPVDICGVHQGLPISNTLATYYMEPFDKKFSSELTSYNRYVDDILVICTRESVDQVKTSLSSELKVMGLSTNPSKTDFGPLEGEFEYLGYRFYRGEVMIRSSSIEGFIVRICSIVNMYKKYLSTGVWNGFEIKDSNFGTKVFLNNLNEKITGAISGDNRYGWIAYYSEIDNLIQLRMLDGIVKKKLARVLEKGHPGKVKTLLRSYYRHKHGNAGGYILDYRTIEELTAKLQYLVEYGHIREGLFLTAVEIDGHFQKARDQHLSSLDKDIGLLS